MAINFQERIQQILAGASDPQARALLLQRLQQSQSPAAAVPPPDPQANAAQMNGAFVNGEWVPLGTDTSFTIKPEQYADLAGEPAPAKPTPSAVDQAFPGATSMFDAATQMAAPVVEGAKTLYGQLPTSVRGGLESAAGWVGSQFEQTPETKATADLLHQGITAQTPQTDSPLLNFAANPTAPLQHLAVNQVADSTTPGGALLTSDILPLGAMAGAVGTGTKKALGKVGQVVAEEAAPLTRSLRSTVAGRLAAETPALVEATAAPGVAAEIKALFPRLDAYAKPSQPISRKVILKRIEATPSLSDEAKATLLQLADQIGDRRVLPLELHALAAGETYTPERVLRKVAPIPEGAKQTVGAPLGVSNARQARALREGYLGSMERGAKGRDWYHDSGEAIFFHANDDPARANLFTGDIAITSPTTSVSANTGFGIKGYNQATAGVPVAAGRYPTAMGAKIGELHAGTEGSLGLKRDPFAGNIARGGGFLEKELPERAVHDIWDAEAHGYVNPDGSPMRAGFGPPQHRFMDRQQDKIIDAANQRATGGLTNWDELRSQAAAWTGQQIDAGRLDPNDAAKSIADYLERHYAQGSRETIPGKTTGHLPELHQPGMERLRERLHSRINTEAGIYDPQMRDQIAAGYGGLTGRSFEGPGVYEGQAAPGRQTQILTGSVEVPGGKGARVFDAGSRRILDASEATYGLLTAQDAGAYSRVLPAGSGHARNAWDITLPGGMISRDQMQTVLTKLGPAAKEAVLIPTPDGIRLAFLDDTTMKRVVKELGGQVKTAGTLQSNLIGNNWQTHRVGQNYFDAIRTMGTEKFDAVAPGMARHLREIDARFAKESGGRFTLSPVMDEVRGAIANEGWAGLERLARKYGVPVAMLATALAELQAKTQASAATDSQ